MPNTGFYLLIFLGGILVIGMVVVASGYRRAIQAARERLEGLGSQVIETRCGPIEYARVGEGTPLLVVHGALGGFDQGLWLARGFDLTNYQVVSVSRFGYLRSPVPANADLNQQADAFACLLDALEIRQAAVFAVSAGSTSAIRFAARHPERVSALVLLVPDAPGEVQMVMPPRFVFDTLLRSDFVYWALVTWFGRWVTTVTGMAPKGYDLTDDQKRLIKTIQLGNLPVSQRMDGMVFESYNLVYEFNASISVSSPYPLSQIETPVLVIHAVDDPIALSENVRALAERMPRARRFVAPDGGHFLFGHTEEAKAEIARFLHSNVSESQPAAIYRLFKLALARPALAKDNANHRSYEAIDAYIEEQMHRLNIPGVSLAIVEGERIVHRRGFGRARPGGEAPLPETPFFIGSLTKSFTALAVMQLVEAGKVELEAPVQRYLPWFRVADPQASARMTVRHLLNQTSGLPMLPGMADLGNLDSRPGAAERQARALSNLKLTRPVGSKFEYSNTNYNLLGQIVEAASGQPYTDYVQQHIFDPLEMRHSYTSKSEAQRNGLAMGHRYWFGFPMPAPNLSVPTASIPSGQLISSSEDMAHYLIAQLNGGRYGDVQILSPAGMDEMQRGAAEINEMGQLLGSYGMGWISQGTGKTRIVSHSGIVPDFGGFMALAPEQKKGIVLLFNVNHVMMKLTFDELGMGAMQRLAGVAPAPPQFGAAPWLMRSLCLIPLLQIAGVAITLGLVRRWRREPQRRPSLGRAWGLYILPALILNLSLALVPFYLLANRLLGFMRLFAPDLAWIALICGGFAGLWSFLRSGLILRALRKD
jgi:CubicO group peptidase (beta-lactamase class C family)